MTIARCEEKVSVQENTALHDTVLQFRAHITCISVKDRLVTRPWLVSCRSPVSRYRAFLTTAEPICTSKRY